MVVGKMGELRPRKGALAFCSLGTLGLITSPEPHEVTYPNGTKGTSWTGIHLTDKICAIGEPWSSRSPIVVAYVSQF